MRYTALMDGEAGGYGVSFPDLPGCVAMGVTVDKALDNAADALRAWVWCVEARGAAVPPPSPIEVLRTNSDVRAELANGASLASVVLVRDTGKPVKANLSLDAGVLAAIDAAAERLKVTRSAFVEMLAREGIGRVT